MDNSSNCALPLLRPVNIVAALLTLRWSGWASVRLDDDYTVAPPLSVRFLKERETIGKISVTLVVVSTEAAFGRRLGAII